jgi:hypothetical protein
MLPPRFRIWVWVLVAIIAVVLLVSFATTRRHKGMSTYFCEQCGMRLWVTTDYKIGSAPQKSEQRRLEETDLSRWFKTYVSTNCEHTWHFNHLTGHTYLSIAGRQLWRISGLAGSYPTPPIILMFESERARVEGLLHESPEKCRSYIHDRLQWKAETDEWSG